MKILYVGDYIASENENEHGRWTVAHRLGRTLTRCARTIDEMFEVIEADKKMEVECSE